MILSIISINMLFDRSPREKEYSVNESIEATTTSQEEDDSEEGKRQRSTIGFPYSDYESAMEVAAAVHGNVGHGDCSQGQLSAWMGQSAKSSGFRTQLAAARLFGLIESENSESIRLAELGKRVVDPAQSRGAKAEAFLRVPLFKALFDKYKDGVTPPAAALEREIATLGVSEKQKGRARQIFESSATQTGYRDAAPNRLVRPAVVVSGKPKDSDTKNSDKADSPDGASDGFILDPLLMALLRKIPKTAASGGWPAESRLRWFRTFAMNVSQVYDDDSTPVEFEIKLRLDQNSTT